MKHSGKNSIPDVRETNIQIPALAGGNTGGAVGKSTMIEQPAQTRYAGDLVSTKEGEQIA
jgi:hypothetical protein